MGIRVFITGAGGYLGGVLAAHLAGLPDIEGVTGIDNLLPPSPWPDKVSLIKMDVRSPEMADVMSGHDFIIHTAFIVQWSANMPAVVRDDINLNGTRNVAQAAVRNRIRGFLYASSVAAYDPIQVHGKENLGEDCPLGKGDSPMYYWNSKALAEMILSEILAPSGIALTFFRMSYVIGPCNRATVPGFRENAVLFPGHDPRAQFVHENDVAQAFAQALAHWNGAVGESFHVVSPAAVTLRGYAEATAAWFGQPAHLSLMPFEQWRTTVSEEDAERTWDHISHSPNCSIAKAQRLLDYQPRYTSLQAVFESVDWLVKDGVVKRSEEELVG